MENKIIEAKLVGQDVVVNVELDDYDMEEIALDAINEAVDKNKVYTIECIVMEYMKKNHKDAFCEGIVDNIVSDLFDDYCQSMNQLFADMSSGILDNIIEDKYRYLVDTEYSKYKQYSFEMKQDKYYEVSVEYNGTIQVPIVAKDAKEAQDIVKHMDLNKLAWLAEVYDDLETGYEVCDCDELSEEDYNRWATNLSVELGEEWKPN